MIVEHNQSCYYKDPYPTTNTGDYDNAFKFNGKELDDATGMYYYGARYYDPRISIFLSVDLLAEDFAGWTPYHYVHNNPINLIDPTGMSADSLKIANTDQTKLYLNSSVNKQNQQFINYDSDGNVTLNFGDKTDKQIQKILKNDSGLATINNMINATDKHGNSENYYFEVSNNREGVLNGEKFSISLSHLEGTTTGRNDNRFMLSLSTTDRGDGLPQINPANGYDGVLYISPGTLMDYDSFDKKERPVDRGRFMNHELKELYLRTHNKMTYPEAHKSAGGHKTYTGFKYD